MALWLLGFCLALFSALAKAQPVAGPVDRLIQQEQQRQQEERRHIENEQRRRTKPLVPEATEAATVADDGACFDVQLVQLNGISAFPLAHFDPTIASYLNQCLGVNQLNQLLQAITRVYFDTGYVTSRAYLPPQNLQSGTVEVQVVEGSIETLERSGEAPFWWDSAFPALENKRLNLRDLEQGLDQINRLQSYSATMKLLPGSSIGASRIEITEQIGRPWHVSSSLSNSGQTSTGEQQLQLMLSWDNPVGLYDYSYLSIQSDIEDTSSDGKKSQSIGWHWDLPLGYWGASFDVSHYEYLLTIPGALQSFESSGISDSQRLTVKRLMHRDAVSKTTLSLTLVRKKNQNFIEDTLIETSSRTLGIAEFALKHEQRFANSSQLLSALTYHRGLNWFGAPDDRQAAADSPKAQFDKYTFSLDYLQPFQLGTQRFQYSGLISGQYSPDILFGSESFSIGSAYTVRGYKQSSLSSNRGAYWRNGLRIPLPQLWGISFTPLIGLDVGLVRDETEHTDKYEKLKGYALGLIARGRHGSLGVIWSKPIDAPDYMQNEGEELQFSLGMNF